MSAKHLLTKSHPVKGSGTSWWYEDTNGIDVIVHPQPTCQHIHITWKALRNALARKDRKP